MTSKTLVSKCMFLPLWPPLLLLPPPSLHLPLPPPPPSFSSYLAGLVGVSASEVLAQTQTGRWVSWVGLVGVSASEVLAQTQTGGWVSWVGLVGVSVLIIHIIYRVIIGEGGSYRLPGL